MSLIYKLFGIPGKPSELIDKIKKEGYLEGDLIVGEPCFYKRDQFYRDHIYYCCSVSLQVMGGKSFRLGHFSSKGIRCFLIAAGVDARYAEEMEKEEAKEMALKTALEIAELLNKVDFPCTINGNSKEAALKQVEKIKEKVVDAIELSGIFNISVQQPSTLKP